MSLQDIWLALVSSNVPQPLAYVGLTLFVPVMGALLAVLACAALIVILLAAGFDASNRGLITLGMFTLIWLAAALLRKICRALPAYWPARLLIDLDSPQARAPAAAGVVGAKAHHLSRLRLAGLGVLPGCVLSARVFEQLVAANAISIAGGDPSSIRRAILASGVPGKLFRELRKRLEALPSESFLLRSSFPGEDAAEATGAGLYESRNWSRRQGSQALADAALQVWASYWSERALASRAIGPRSISEIPALAILIQPLFEHESWGFASSAEIHTGFRDRHMVDVSSPKGNWVAVHDLLDGSIRAATGSGTGDSIDRSLVNAVSRRVGLTESALGLPVEIEWGARAGTIHVYQGRPLLGLNQVRTFTNSFLVELPRIPMPPFSRSLVFGDGSSERIFDSLVAALGLRDGLPLGSLQFFREAPYLWFEPLKAIALGGSHPTTGGRILLRTLIALVRTLHSHRPSTEGRRATATSAGSRPTPAKAIESLARIRIDELGPRMRDQMKTLQAAAILEGLVRDLESSDGSSPLARDLPTLPGWVTTRARDRLLTERERIREEIADLQRNAEALGEVVSESFAIQLPEWAPEDFQFLSLTELASFAQGSDDLRSAFRLVRERKLVHRENLAAHVPSVVRVGPGNEPVCEGPPSDPELLMATGIPVGSGVSRGPLVVLRPRDVESIESSRDAVVLLPDPSMAWALHAAVARGVVAEQGGPLSHLALWCRERRIPAVLGARGATERIPPGTTVEVDGDSGEVRLA